MLAVAIVLLALTRAEIVERMKAPVVTQAEGLVQVYAGCPEDMRREYQLPIASFAAETVKALYRGLAKRPIKFRKPGIVIHVGDVRTNLTDVVARVATNGTRVVSRIFVKSPGYADIDRLRIEVIKGFYRSVESVELSDADAVLAYRKSDPSFRIMSERQRLEDWLAGRLGELDDEEGLKLMRKIIEPGKASRRDVLIFASRLFLYPPTYDLTFVGRFKCLSFREALKWQETDPCIRIMATLKAKDMPVFGGGRGDALTTAAYAYENFLLELGKGEKDVDELRALLDDADTKLNVAFESARP